MRKAEAFVARLNERALAMDGTCTGEHGIGQGKMPFLEAELGDALDLMRQVKRALDPRQHLQSRQDFCHVKSLKRMLIPLSMTGCALKGAIVRSKRVRTFNWCFREFWFSSAVFWSWRYLPR